MKWKDDVCNKSRVAEGRIRLNIVHCNFERVSWDCFFRTIRLESMYQIFDLIEKEILIEKNGICAMV